MLFAGRLESQAPEIDGRVYINDFEGAEPQAGEFRWATITGSSDYDLVARLEARTFAPQPAFVPKRDIAPRLVQIESHDSLAMSRAHALPHV